MKKLYSIFSFLILSFYFVAFSQPSFNPSNISGLLIWYAADSSVSYDSAKRVFQWNDLSGDSNNAIQADTSKEAIFFDSISVLNNKPVLHFDGINDFMQFAPLNVRTVFFVIRHANGTDNYQTLLGNPTDYKWHGGLGAKLFNTYSPQEDDIINGQGFVNGIPIAPINMVKPVQYSILSLITAGPHPAERITGDDPSNNSASHWKGDYAEIIIYDSPLPDSDRVKVETYLSYKYAPPVNLGPDITVNYGFCPITINAAKPWLNTYLWNTNETTDSIVVNSSGNFSVNVLNTFNYPSSDLIKVTYPGNFKPFSDTTVCLDDTLVWNTQLEKNGYYFLWNNDSNFTDSVFYITQPGQYFVQVTDSFGCSIISDTITVTVDSFPQLNFLSDSISLCAGNSISTLVSANEYLWSTGDSSSAIVIDSPNTYSVTVTNSLGCSSIDSINISIKGTAPSINFSTSVTCKGDSTQFTDMTNSPSGLSSWLWNFGDASSTSSAQNPIHLYADSGMYMVNLTVTTNAGCSQTFSDSIKIFPLPKADFISTTPSVGGNTQFTDISNSFNYPLNSWSWNFDDIANAPNDTSASQNPVFQFAQSGNHNVKLVVQTQQQCVDSTTKTVFVYDIIPSFISGLKLWIGADNGIAKDTNNYVSQWNDISVNGNNAIQSDTSKDALFLDSISVLNNKPVLHFDGINDFMQFTPLNVRTVFFVIRHANGTDNYQTLLGNPTDYKWHGGLGAKLFNTYSPQEDDIINGQGFVNGIPIAPINMVKPVQYSILSLITAGPHPAERITGDDPSNNSASHWKGDYAEIIIYDTPLNNSQRQQVEKYLSDKYAPPVNLGPDITVNYGFCPITINAAKPWLNTYLWNTNETTDSIVVNSSGNFSVNVLNTFNYPSSDSIKVTYPGNFKPFSDTTICFGDTLIWNSQLEKNGYSFLWNNDSNSIDSVFYITQPGQYFVQITDSFGCSIISDTIIVTVDSFPQLNFLSDSISLCAGNSISTLVSANEYLWSTGDSSSAIVIDSADFYSVTVTNSLGCSSIDSINITISGIAPTVNFSAPDVCLGNSVLFTNSSTTSDSSNIISYQWYFGDNSFDTDTNPLHFYSSNGDFFVSLSVQTDSGCSNSKTDTVVVHSLPQTNFYVNNPILCSEDSISFSDISVTSEGTITNWFWNFGDTVNNYSDSANPSHYYFSGGNFIVSLVTENSFGCADTFSKPVTVHPQPVAGFYHTSGCEKDTTKFYDNTSGVIINRNWDFEDGNTSLQTNPDNIYDTAGTYIVSLIVKTIFGCIDTVSDSVIVYHNPVAGFSNIDFCRGTPVRPMENSTVDSSTIVAWNWNVLQTPVSSTEQNPYFNFDSSSDITYPVKLKVTSKQGCTDDTIQFIHIHNQPTADFSFSSPYGETPVTVNFTNNSSDSAISFSWNFGTGGTSALQNPSFTFQDSGEFQIQLICYTQYGCADTIVKKIKMRKPILDIAVTQVRTNKNNNFMTVSADLYNLGNLEINSFDIIAEISNSSAVKENWTGVLAENRNIEYVFNASFEINNYTLPDAVCVRVEKPNSEDDDNPGNNELCISFSDFKIIAMYPNPVNNELILEYTLTGKEESVQILVFDAIGKKVEELISLAGQKGLYRVTINTSGFSNGIYALKIIYGENYEVKRFVKSKY